MLNTGKLANRTAFITGASRGIGKAIALKLAKDGANIVIAAKTTQPHPKLPGTIYSAAEEVEAAGGKCLPCVVDIRYEDQIQKAVDEAVKKFGGIDIVINNASAISLTGTLDIDMKRYDLMHNINTRGTFLTSKCCIPYLKQGKNPHILNLSPPLNLNPLWFKNHVAYTMAKYGMSMCVLGMAEELRDDKIAVNALWPLTAISTAAMEMLGGQEALKQCRKPEIMSDAAYVILTKDSQNFTGNFCIDEEVLKTVGVTDFSTYAYDKDTPLMPDLFVDTDSNFDLEQLQKLKTSAPSAQSSSGSSAPTLGGKVENVFNKLRPFLNEEVVKQIGASYSFNLSGAEKGNWHIDLKNAPGSAGPGEIEKTDVTFTMDSDDFYKMFTGTLKPTAAFMTGKLKIKGDMGKAMKVEKIMGQLKGKL